ncbi:MAG: hypothetical protein RSC66_12285, partial [Comamonas sp.]
MKDIIGAFTRRADVLRSEIASRLRELEALERQRLTEEKDRARDKRRARLDKEIQERLRAQALRDVLPRLRSADADLLATWGERARAWSEIVDVFGDLGEMMGRGWDFSCGVLRHTGWLDLLRLRKLIEQLPQLREIVRALGRLHAAQDDESVAQRILAPVRRLELERREVRTPLIPAEMRGLERSGDIARMLPIEALMLGHRTLRMLWHARRSERALLTYRVEGVELARVQREREVLAEIEAKRPRPERGPIVAVVDTSGSMNGLPGQV